MEPDPRRWWSGMLDVEQLAWSAVVAARDAARRVAERRGMDVRIDADAALTAAAFAAIEHLRVDGAEPGGWAPMSGFFATRDGWVRTHANYPHHAAAITAALDATTRDDLARAVAGMTALDVEETVTAHRGIAVAVRTPEQWATHPHAHATRTDPWSCTTVTGTTRPLAPTPGADVGLPLSGVRVLDLTRVIAGPTCSQLLACLGADVLRLDPPARPELLEQYLSNGMGKHSVAADLTEPHTRDALPGLLQACDVALLGYRPGSLARFGLDPDALTRRYPHLVVASLSAWGEHGPWAHRPGFDSIVQAATGIATLCGDGERPGALPVQALDHATGYRMAADIMNLLADRDAGVIRISLLGAARTLLALPAAPVQAAVDLPVRTLELPTPYGAVQTVPPALTLNGSPLTAPLTAYGAAPIG